MRTFKKVFEKVKKDTPLTKELIKEVLSKANKYSSPYFEESKEELNQRAKFELEDNYLNFLHLYFNWEKLDISELCGNYSNMYLFRIYDKRGVLRFTIENWKFTFEHFDGDEDFLSNSLREVILHEYTTIKQWFKPKIGPEDIKDLHNKIKFDANNYDVILKEVDEIDYMDSDGNYLCYNSLDYCVYFDGNYLLKYFKAEGDNAYYFYTFNMELKNAYYDKNKLCDDGDMILYMFGDADYSNGPKWSTVSTSKTIINLSKLILISHFHCHERYSKS